MMWWLSTKKKKLKKSDCNLIEYIFVKLTVEMLQFSKLKAKSFKNTSLMKIKQKMINQKKNAIVKCASATSKNFHKAFQTYSNPSEKQIVEDFHDHEPKNEKKQSRMGLMREVEGYGRIDKENREPNISQSVPAANFGNQKEGVRNKNLNKNYAPKMIHSCYESEEQGPLITDLRIGQNPMADGQDRPITFGTIKREEPSIKNSLRASQQYLEDKKITNQILLRFQDGYNLRKSQEENNVESTEVNNQKYRALRTSRDFSASGKSAVGEGDQMRCYNHALKKAKYRLQSEMKTVRNYRVLSQNNNKDQGEKDGCYYCSKCAINLLQQGFKVQQINKNSLTNNILKSHKHTLSGSNLFSLNSQQNSQSSRLQDIRNFQRQLVHSQRRSTENINNLSYQMQEKSVELDRNLWHMEGVYDYLIESLQEMKREDMRSMKKNRESYLNTMEGKEKEQTLLLQNIVEIKRELKEYRNKFVIMKESQFQKLLSTHLDVITNIGEINREAKQDHCHYHIDLKAKINSILEVICIQAQDLAHSLHERSESSEKQPQSQPQYQYQPQYQSQYQPQQSPCRYNEFGSQIKRPFRTLFTESESNQKEEEYRFYGGKKILEGTVVDLYTSNENQSPSFQKNERPLMKFNDYDGDDE